VYGDLREAIESLRPEDIESTSEGPPLSAEEADRVPDGRAGR
jgi:hypothetical protein